MGNHIRRVIDRYRYPNRIVKVSDAISISGAKFLAKFVDKIWNVAHGEIALRTKSKTKTSRCLMLFDGVAVCLDVNVVLWPHSRIAGCASLQSHKTFVMFEFICLFVVSVCPLIPT